MISPAIIYLALASLAFVIYRTISNRGKKLPPGPKGYPLIGNLLDVATLERPAETFREWSKVYGDVMSFTMYGHTTVILNTAKAAIDLLEKRSTNYSNRPRFMYVNEMMAFAWDVGHLPYGDWWRFHRRVFHQYFQPIAVAKHQHLQIRSAVSLMTRLGETPDLFPVHLRAEIGRAILKVVYDYESEPVNDPFVALADNTMFHLVTGMQPGKFLVEYFTFLKYIPAWMPGAHFKRFAQNGAELATQLRNKAFDVVKANVENGTAGESFVQNAITRFEEFHDDPTVVEAVVKSNAASAFVAGADTTVSSTLTFILAMTLHPEIQKKAQAEIDSVVGNDRLPDYSDRENLPFLEAMLWETLRWMTVTPLGGIPHASVNDDEYEGHFIPGGATIFPNIWGILHDPVAYPEPDTFNPERFMDEEANKAANINPDPRQFNFGFGRRICPGRYFAMDATWSVMVTLLASFDIKPKVVNGKEVLPIADWTGGAASFPKPYETQFVWRSEEKKKLVALKHEEVNNA